MQNILQFIAFQFGYWSWCLWQILLAAGANLEAADSLGYTALMEATTHNKSLIVEVRLTRWLQFQIGTKAQYGSKRMCILFVIGVLTK